MLAWLSVWSKVQMICVWFSWCHCLPVISCFRKIHNGLSFWYRPFQIVLEKRPLDVCVCVCVCVLPPLTGEEKLCYYRLLWYILYEMYATVIHQIADLSLKFYKDIQSNLWHVYRNWPFKPDFGKRLSVCVCYYLFKIWTGQAVKRLCVCVCVCVFV